MERIIKAIEEKLASQEFTILVQKHEIEELKKKLAEAEQTIAEQAKLIVELKGENR